MNFIRLRSVSLMIFVLVSMTAAHTVRAQEAEKKSSVRINSPFSARMIEFNSDLRKIDILLEERQKGALDNGTLTFGTSLVAIADYQKATDDSKFGYLMRHPTAANQIGDVVSEAVLHSFQFGVTVAVNDWMTSFVEVLYDPEQSFGAGTITTLSRNQLQLRKGFVLIGDLNKYPIYGAVGKMDAPFGEMGSVNPFSNSTMWHAYSGLAYGAQVGVKTNGFSAVFMAVQGGAQFRALNTPVGDATNVPSKMNNYVADVNYTKQVNDDLNVKVGASYMKGSAYCQDFPVTHFSPCQKSNPAKTAYGRVQFKNRLTVLGGYAITDEIWPGTVNPTPPLNVFEASKVSSVEVGAKFKINESFTVSGEFSNFIAGPHGAPWHRQNQFIAGVKYGVGAASDLFLEVFKVDGYVPLNFISGSADFKPFAPGETHSKADANSLGVVVGAHITL